jgi:hypothetical protein
MKRLTQLYSPHRPEEYSRSDGRGRIGIGQELRYPHHRPLWNLYWLSDPNVDFMLEPEEVWVSSPPIDLTMLSACGEALGQKIADQTVGAMVSTLSAREFVKLLRSNEHQHLAPYVYAKQAWVVNLAQRSAGYVKAANVTIDGVTWADFGHSIGLATGGGQSATITPLRGKPG